MKARIKFSGKSQLDQLEEQLGEFISSQVVDETGDTYYDLPCGRREVLPLGLPPGLPEGVVPCGSWTRKTQTGEFWSGWTRSSGTIAVFCHERLEAFVAGTRHSVAEIIRAPAGWRWDAAVRGWRDSTGALVAWCEELETRNPEANPLAPVSEAAREAA